MLDKTTRLRFSEDELADRNVRKAAGKAEKAADKADKAKEKLVRRQAVKKPSDKLRHGKADTSEAVGSEKVSAKSKKAVKRAQKDKEQAATDNKKTEEKAPNRNGTKLKSEPSSAAAVISPSGYASISIS